jgi:hypothetical protein
MIVPGMQIHAFSLGDGTGTPVASPSGSPAATPIG